MEKIWMPRSWSCFLLAFLWIGCSSKQLPHNARPLKARPLFAHLGPGGGNSQGLSLIRQEFTRRNPGYDLFYDSDLKKLTTAGRTRVIFIQSGKSCVRVAGTVSKVDIGDVILLRKDESVQAEPAIGALIFDVPGNLPQDLPPVVRPDWDPKITDIPGGCATETGAYRRILLTWEAKNGPYLYHALNAHRVRMMDSLTHYHPAETGFDEFYLVQMALPGARVLTSRFVEKVTQPEKVAEKDLEDLVESHPLQVGDLAYLPRGIIHRGLGGVLAQVITIPGFKPGAQIGVDPFLLEINRRFRLVGERVLPYNLEAATQLGR